MFKVDEYVVYKNNVCKVKEVNTKNGYYTLAPIEDESLIIKVLIDNNKSLRKLISKKELEKIISEIPNIPLIEDNDRLIENDYKELMRSGTYEDYVKIIKTTYLRNKQRLEANKKVGDKDKHYLQEAEKSLYDEFAVVLGKTFEETKKYVEDAVSQIEWKRL